jgi:hypothetical protein
MLIFAPIGGTIYYMADDMGSMLGLMGKDIDKIIKNSESSNDSATLILKTHVINTNGGTRQASDFSNCVDTSHGNNKSLQCQTGSEEGTTTISFDPGPYRVYQNPQKSLSGYHVVYSSNCSGIMHAGQRNTCTVTYRDSSMSP